MQMSAGYYDRPPVPRKLQSLSSSSDFDSHRSHTRVDRDDESPFVEQRSSTVPLSMNGLESVDALLIDDDSSMALSSLGVRDSSQLFEDDGFDKAVEKVWDEMGNKRGNPEYYTRISLTVDNSERSPCTNRGQLCADGVIDGAVVIKVGIAFLPGADRPEVNRLEQFDMTGKEPDQQDAMWRVNTAAALLSVFDVDKQLSVVQSDQTAKIAERAHQRRASRPDFLVSKDNALTRDRGSRFKSHQDAVTIDSAEVRITNDLCGDDFDVSSTLIEVDGGSLISLMVHYRKLVLRAGPDPPFEVTRELLETMIEDARRLCVRSPILFRMSTRTKIIKSKNTRYGVNTPDGFSTITTSKGIQETISQSASYFNSLDPTSSSDKTQAFIRPRFLQMIVLLLSLLNDEDLKEISEFLETTYNLRADRPDIELLFMKVIPLMSINSKVFLKAMVPAYEGWDLNVPVSEENYDFIWQTFIQRILMHGYILPGTVDALGSVPNSWIPKWPCEGIKSTGVFDNLQFQGSGRGHTKTFNDIPPIEIRPEFSAADSTLRVILTDVKEYKIDSNDLEQITCMIAGNYSITEASESGRRYDLVIQEQLLNESIIAATNMVNDVIRKANRWLTGQKKTATVVGRQLRRLAGRRLDTTQLQMMNERVMVPRLTQNSAFLNQTNLAITFKTAGRRITKKTAMRELEMHRKQIGDIVQYYLSGLDTLGFHSGITEAHHIKDELEKIQGALKTASYVRNKLAELATLNDEPIAKVDFPGGLGPTDVSTWSDYKAWLSTDPRTHTNALHVEGKHATVKTLVWRTNDLADVVLDGSVLRYTVKPLNPVHGVGRDDEIQEGDRVLLVGYYMVIAVEEELPAGGVGWCMTNWMRVVGVEEGLVSRRGRNRLRNCEAQGDDSGKMVYDEL
ncbi:hypothetical protein FKW77_007105 [Venturia effusa]|uniref:Uncharacterized protein n=1 Tax=Venturia effusa TaxID=50376 RepID=A0A517LCM2_9PEZI|nr:hypothetical protein FKW77_007105 [Venturia effusa]